MFAFVSNVYSNMFTAVVKKGHIMSLFVFFPGSTVSTFFGLVSEAKATFLFDEIIHVVTYVLQGEVGRLFHLVGHIQMPGSNPSLAYAAVRFDLSSSSTNPSLKKVPTGSGKICSPLNVGTYGVRMQRPLCIRKSIIRVQLSHL